jgi:hypothetical protein
LKVENLPKEAISKIKNVEMMDNKDVFFNLNEVKFEIMESIVFHANDINSELY